MEPPDLPPCRARDLPLPLPRPLPVLADLEEEDIIDLLDTVVGASEAPNGVQLLAAVGAAVFPVIDFLRNSRPRCSACTTGTKADKKETAAESFMFLRGLKTY